MKFLEITSFLQVNAFLHNVESFSGDSFLSGRIEAYSFKLIPAIKILRGLTLFLGKRAGSDKKLYKNLEEQYQVQLSKSPEAFEDGAVSPFGPLTESSSRKTLINLISILNASFPDYDFSNASSEQFRKEINHYMVINSINTMLNNAISNYAELSNKLWTSLDSEIRIKECDIYSYFPDCDSDPYAEEDAKIPIWSFHYFLYNRKLRRIVYFTCRASSKLDQIPADPTLSEDDEEDMWQDSNMEL